MGDLQDVATQLSSERLEAGGGVANGAGKWQGKMDREQLTGHGYIVERGLLQALRSELGELLVAGRKAYNLTKDGRLSRRERGGATARGPGCMLSTRRGRAGREEHHAGGGAERGAGIGTTVCSARAGGHPGGRGGQGGAQGGGGGRHFLLGTLDREEPQASHLDGEPQLAFLLS